MHGMQSMGSGPVFQTEEEVTLIVCSEDPQSVLNDIAELTVLGDFRLYPSDTLNVHDRYFDTAGRSLRDLQVALRVRQIGSKTWITFKGPSRTIENGFGHRMELEAEWSAKALTETLDLLAKSGIELPRKANASAWAHPLDGLNAVGMVLVQDRQTHRMVRDIVPSAADGTLAAAQLLLDSVVYRFQEQEVRHHEVEIEAQTSDGTCALKALAERLREKFGRALQSWNHSKLATGWAVEDLWDDLHAAGLIKEDCLLPSAYDYIDRFLS
jgi:hypothetical protein